MNEVLSIKNNIIKNINDITLIINILSFSVFHVRFIEDGLRRKVQEDDIEFI